MHKEDEHVPSLQVEDTSSVTPAPETEETAEEYAEYEDPFPREGIVALKHWCTAPAGSGCDRCLAVCPTGTISLKADGPEIDADQCTLCGLCAGICDAYAWERITLKDLVERAKREAKEEGIACFTCNDHLFDGLVPRSNVIVLPCLAAVPPEFWTCLLAENIPIGIYRDASYCESCQVAGDAAMPLFAYALDSAQEWTGRVAKRLKDLPERESILAMYSNVDESDRRGIIATAVYEGLDIASGKHRKRNSGTVSDFHEQQERLKAQNRIKAAAVPKVGLAAKHAWPRQELAVRAAKALPEKAEDMVRYTSCTDAEACCKSHVCIEDCPTGARVINRETGLPTVDASRCFACGICVARCPHGACDFEAITGAAYLSQA